MFDKCESCQAPLKDSHRRLCWSCTAYKKRYHDTWQQQKADANKALPDQVCRFCGAIRRGHQRVTSGLQNCCARCAIVVNVINDQDLWYKIVSAVSREREDTKRRT